jgi:hypothetical protein
MVWKIMKTFKEYIAEALSSAERFQRARMMKRQASKMAFKRKIASKKPADPERIKKRASSKAKMLIRSRLLNGKNYNDLPVSQKMAIDKRVDSKTVIIQKLTQKLIPVIKKMEKERLAKAKQNS